MNLDLEYTMTATRKIEAMIKAEMKSEVARYRRKSPKKPVTKSMMEALRNTAES